MDAEGRRKTRRFSPPFRIRVLLSTETEEQKKRGRPGNEAMIVICIHCFCQTSTPVDIPLRVRMEQHAEMLDLISMSVCVQQGLREAAVRGRQVRVTPTPA